MNFDPILKKAALEIQEIMQKYEIGGFVSLTSKTHGEFVTVLNPPWSVIKQTKENGSINIRVLSRSQDFKSREEQRIANDLTAHLVFSQADMALNLLKTLDYLKTKLNEAWNVTHQPQQPVDTEYNA